MGTIGEKPLPLNW